MTFDVVAAGFLMPVTMLVAAQGRVYTAAIFLILPLFMMGIYYKSLKSRTGTRFFFSWSMTSFFFLMAVFELEVVPYLEILFIENFILICFVSAMCFCAYCTKLHTSLADFLTEKSDDVKNGCELIEHEFPKCEICKSPQFPRSKHCNLCGNCVLRQVHHCMWLDVCVEAKNHRYFLCGLIFLFISCCYCANLTLTTVCHPVLVGGMILLPDDCSDVYGDFHISICFVSALYILVIACCSFVKLLHQSWLLWQSSFSQGRKPDRRGQPFC